MNFLLKIQYNAIDMVSMAVAGTLIANGYILLAVLCATPILSYVVGRWWNNKKGAVPNRLISRIFENGHRLPVFFIHTAWVVQALRLINMLKC